MKHALMALERMELSTDLYELTMAQAFLEAGIVERQATFELSVRALPPHRGYLVVAGLEQALAYIRDLHFRPEALAYLEGSGHFRREFVDYLESMRFTGSVAAIPEGTVYFPPGPLLRVTAPIIEAQILETFLLTTLTFQSMVCSKASRIVEAAAGRDVIDFSPRRGHGPQAGLLAARASYIGGCIGTSNVLANDEFGIPVFGTMAHSFIMLHPDEEEAFRVFSRSYPNDPTLLIDTFDTLEGARIAVKLLPELAQRGQRLAGVRLDSGDLLELSLQVREILDKGGASSAKIFASGDLDEHKIAALVTNGAKIDGFGVGTQLGTSGDAPALSSTYKLVACEDNSGNEVPVIKLSTAKVSLPGRKQIWRQYNDSGDLIGDTVGMEDEDLPGEPLLVPYMADGRLLQRTPALEKIRSRATDQVASLPVGARGLRNPEAYPVEISAALVTVMEQLQQR